jgi:hypothetical protein
MFTFTELEKYYACDVTLSVYPHRDGLKNMPGHGGKILVNKIFSEVKFFQAIVIEKSVWISTELTN